MARITVEDCLKQVDNRFELIHLASKRVRQLRKGAEPMVGSKNTDIVVALREIAAGHIFRVDNDGEQPLFLSDSMGTETTEFSEQTAVTDNGEADQEAISPDD